MLVGVELVGDVEIGVAEQIERRSARPVRFERLKDRLGRVPLMHKERERRHRHLLPLGLPAQFRKAGSGCAAGPRIGTAT